MTTSSDIEVSYGSEGGAHHTPAAIADINSRLDGNTPNILAALDKLTPLKVQYSGYLQLHPGTY